MRKKEIIINEILIPSLCKLYEMDYVNIQHSVSERNICARLAHHMENIMREYDKNNNDIFYNCYADVEYNRTGRGHQKYFENSQKIKKKMVSDLLIQERGFRNLLAVEMKRKGYKEHVNEDKDRLKKLVSTTPPESDDCVYGTLVGAFITYSKDDVTICLFEDKNGYGVQVGEMQLCYNTDTGRLESKDFVSHSSK